MFAINEDIWHDATHLTAVYDAVAKAVRLQATTPYEAERILETQDCALCVIGALLDVVTRATSKAGVDLDSVVEAAKHEATAAHALPPEDEYYRSESEDDA